MKRDFEGPASALKHASIKKANGEFGENNDQLVDDLREPETLESRISDELWRKGGSCSCVLTKFCPGALACSGVRFSLWRP